jgi:6-phosphogluconolactonase
MDPSPDIRIVATPSAIADTAAALIVDSARSAVAARERFTIALAGGATPRETYWRLALAPYAEQMPWRQTWVFFGDERGVPPEDQQSNYRMASEALLSKVPIPTEQVFRIRGEAEDLDEAAADYAGALKRVFGTRRGQIPRFDLILLGLGIDGHTGSLFPGSPAARETFRTVVAVHAAAAAIPQRITFTLPLICAAAHVVFLVSGPEKAKVVKSVLADRAPLPPTMAQPEHGRLTWIVDRDAAALLPAGHG